MAATNSVVPALFTSALGAAEPGFDLGREAAAIGIEGDVAP